MADKKKEVSYQLSFDYAKNLEDKRWYEWLQPTYENCKHNFGIIYRIYCKETNISYVGQSSNNLINIFNAKKSHSGKPSRILSHLNGLKKGCHPHKQLQEAYNKNPESIVDELLEIVPFEKMNSYSKKKLLSEKEKYWQRKYKKEGNLTDTKPNFYQLTRKELEGMKEFMTNESLVYLILKLENPFCDRPLKIEPLKIALDWDIPESSVYESVLKLKKRGLLEIKKSEMILQWINSENSEGFWNLRENSENSERILRSQNGFRNVRIDSENSENQPLEPIQSKDCGSSQTSSDLFKPSHTFSDSSNEISETNEAIQGEGEGEIINNFLEELIPDFWQEEPTIKKVDPEELILREEKQPIINDSLATSKSTNYQVITDNLNIPSDCSINTDKTRNLIPSKYEECDREFLEWKAKDWATHFGYSLTKAHQNLKKCLRKSPDKIAEYWEDWQEAKAEVKEQQEVLVEFDGNWITKEECDRLLEERKNGEIPVNPEALNLINDFLNTFRGKNAT